MPFPLLALVLWCGGLLGGLSHTAPDSLSFPMLGLYVASVAITLAVLWGMLLSAPMSSSASDDLNQG